MSLLDLFKKKGVNISSSTSEESVKQDFKVLEDANKEEVQGKIEMDSELDNLLYSDYEKQKIREVFEYMGLDEEEINKRLQMNSSELKEYYRKLDEQKRADAEAKNANAIFKACLNREVKSLRMQGQLQSLEEQRAFCYDRMSSFREGKFTYSAEVLEQMRTFIAYEDVTRELAHQPKVLIDCNNLTSEQQRFNFSKTEMEFARINQEYNRRSL